MKRPEPIRRGSGLSPTEPALLATPLDFIIEEHLRARQICAVIDGLASNASLDRQAAVTVLRFLNEELNMHLRDEAEDLFCLLVRRCTAEDDIESAISRIRSDQDKAALLIPGIRIRLASCLDAGAELSVEDGKILTRFASLVRRHLVAENAILLPIARARLKTRDLQTLSQNMRARRGLLECPP